MSRINAAADTPSELSNGHCKNKNNSAATACTGDSQSEYLEVDSRKKRRLESDKENRAPLLHDIELVLFIFKVFQML